MPFLPLMTGVTPVVRQAELETETGAASLHFKDDSRGAPPYGGNKPRKLEWLLGDAQARGFREVIAIGADGSNYCLSTAIHGTRAGFRVTLVTMPQPPIDEVRANLLTGVATGAIYVPTGSDAALLAEVTRRVAAGAMRGDKPYATWFGGSSPLGAVGFVDAALELMDQTRAGILPRPDVVFVPCGSVGSQAGLEVGLRLDEALHGGRRSQVVGVRVTPKIMSNANLVALTGNRCAALLRERDQAVPRVRLQVSELTVRTDSLGPGYGLSTPASEAARERLASLGVELDPTYSSKAMAALLGAGEAGDLEGKNVVFWNTFNACDLSALPKGTPDQLPRVLRERAFPGA